MNRSRQDRGNRGRRKGVHPGIHQEALELLRALPDDGSADRDAASRLVDLAGGGRSASRAVVAALEVCEPAGVLRALREAADLDDDASLERLVRLARGRSGEAQRRTNPIACNEGFTCLNCGTDVSPATGGFQRNHCPRCLHSRHVDVVPGDRQNPCGGLMEPVAVEQAGSDRVLIHHRCVECGATQRVRAALGRTHQPDSRRALRAVSSEPRG